MTEKVHTLQLKIDASAAKRGSSEFVGAVKAVQQAVSQLDRDTNGLFSKLSKGAAFRVDTKDAAKVTDVTKAAQKATEDYSNAARRTAIAVQTAMRVSSTETQRMAQRLDRLGDATGLDQLNRELDRLKANLATATSPLDVRSARSGFLDVRDDLKRRAVDLEQVALREAAAARTAAEHGAELDRLRSKFNPLFAASKQYETALEEITRAEKLGAISAKQATAARADAAARLAEGSARMDAYGRSLNAMSFQSQNAAFQLQDVFVTAEMGMSPFRIMTQQGLQLSMVMEDMARTSGGAQGALTGLGRSLASMISPMTLLTLAATGGAAVLIQWGLSALTAGEDAETFEDRLDALTQAVADYRRFVTEAATSTTDLAARFGSLSPQASATSAALRDIAQLEAIRAADAAVGSLTERFGGLSRTSLTYANGVMSELDATFFNLRDTLNLTDIQAAAVARSLEGLANAETMAEKVAAANALNAAFLRVFGSVEAIPTALLDVQREALLVALQVAEIEGAANGVNAAAQARAATMLADLRQQANMQQLIAKYGKDSLQVAEARVSAERDVFAATVDTMDVSEATKEELYAAWDAANGIASTNMAGAISPAASEAERLAAALGIALSTAVQLSINTPAMRDEDAVMSQQVLPDAAQRDSHRQALANFKRITAPRPTRGGGGRPKGGGGRASALSEEQRLAEKLNKSLEDRLGHLQAERLALDLMTQGQFETTEAAKLFAEAATESGGAVDAQTAAMVRQIDAATVLNDKLKRLAEDPVREWIESVPTWTEAGKAIEAGAIDSLSDSLSQMMQTGQFSFEELGRSILATASDVIADMAVREMMTLFGVGGQGDQPFGFGLGEKLQEQFGYSAGSMTDPANGGTDLAMQAGSQTAAQTIQTAMVTGGQQAAASMRTALTGAAAPSGAMIGGQVTTGAATGGAMMGTQVQTSGQGAALAMQNAITQGGSQAASMISQATAGKTGGSMGGFGGIGMMIGMTAISALLGGGSKSAPATAQPEPEFQPVASYAKGTANTSGIPAMLHDNEAVIPLSGNRKVPVELGENGKDGKSTHVTNHFNITTQDADSFRRSQKQIAADMTAAGQRAMKENR